MLKINYKGTDHEVTIDNGLQLNLELSGVSMPIINQQLREKPTFVYAMTIKVALGLKDPVADIANAYESGLALRNAADPIIDAALESYISGPTTATRRVAKNRRK